MKISADGQALRKGRKKQSLYQSPLNHTLTLLQQQGKLLTLLCLVLACFFTSTLGHFHLQYQNYNLSGCTKTYLEIPLNALSSIFIWWADLKQQICIILLSFCLMGWTEKSTQNTEEKSKLISFLPVHCKLSSSNL